MKITSLLRVLFVAFGLLSLTLLSLWHVSLVRGDGPIELTKTLNRSGNVVRVGEALDFTIALTNNSAFTLTGVKLIDTYDQTTLAFAEATPAESSVDAAAGLITWNNVAETPIPPGASIVLTVVFTAEHPKTAIVNAVRAQDLITEGGKLSITVETSRTQEAIGGHAPVVKFLAPGATPQAGLPVTFTHIITNDGAARLTHLPLTDTYDAAFLQFQFATPEPDITNTPGLLVWNDLTDYFGDLPPFASVVITTVFSATTQVLNTVNRANTEGAIDEYDNDLTGGFAEVPITIITDTPTPTLTPTPEEEDDEDDEDDDDEATATPAPILNTPTPLATSTVEAAVVVTTTVQAGPTGPRYLPETGGTVISQLLIWLSGLTLIGLGWRLRRNGG